MTNNMMKTMRYVGKHGIVRPRDLEALDIPANIFCVCTGGANSADLAGVCTLCQTLLSQRDIPTLR